MLTLLPDWPAFSIFLVATLAVGAAPGPGMMFAVARSIGQGRLAGAVSVLGLSLGSFMLCLAVAYFFGRLDDWLATHRKVWRMQQWFTASIFCAIAGHLILADRR